MGQFGGLPEAVTEQQQNSCIPFSLLPANRQGLFTKCRGSIIYWSPIHSFLTFAHFPPSISHMGAQASPACSAVFDLCTRKSVSSQLHISKQIKFALVVHLKPDRSPFVRFVVQDPKPAKPHSPSGSLSTRGLLQWGLTH